MPGRTANSTNPVYSEPSRGQPRRVAAGALGVLGVLVSLAALAGAGVVLAAKPSARTVALFYRLDLALLGYFVLDVLLRAALADRARRVAGLRWQDAIVLLAAVQALGGGHAAWACFLARQGITLAARFGRGNGRHRLLRRLLLQPARLMVVSFAGAVLIGALLLNLPMASRSGHSIGTVDALFTATSAVCVTGLTVKDTGADFTLFGQLVILVLIQLGGLGIATFSVSLALTVGRAISQSQVVVMQDVLDEQSAGEVLALVQFITLSTLVIEAVGAAALFYRFGAADGYTLRTLYAAVFHSISAFCNAGFSLFPRNLEACVGDLGVSLVVTSLIIAGGIGFPVLRDLTVVGRRRRLAEGRPVGLRTHSKIVLSMTAFLVVFGAILFYALERRGTLAALPPGQRAMASYFQSVTARTAGFNTVDIARVGPAALSVLMLLMFVGASPGSTGGGVKTTAAAILLAAMRSAFRRRPEVEIFQRTVPRGIIRRSTAVVMLSLLLLAAATIALAAVERQPFEKLLFEAVSAFGTVGLSAGATPHLTVAGRLVIVVLMFIGRIGPLTLTLSLVGESRPAPYRYPETHIMVG